MGGRRAARCGLGSSFGFRVSSGLRWFCFERARLQPCRRVLVRVGALAPEGDVLKPTREHATHNAQTYLVTAATWERRPLFKNDQWARLFLDTMHSYRGRAYDLHEYVLMPDHFHILITPSVTLERAVQFIKGGFSYRAKRELESSMEVWQRGFSDHRIRDAEDFACDVEYIFRNPVGRKLVESAAEYPYCSRFPGSEKDEVPQWLKPQDISGSFGTAEAVPFQSKG
jgi:REP-associated tyrosine transposase